MCRTDFNTVVARGFRRAWAELKLGATSFETTSGVLVGALALEIAIFSATAQNFFTIGNFAEILRLGIELGLLAVALTPVIVTGGIDLSVGSMLGLAAVIFGAAYRDWHLPIPLAAGAALAAGAIGGGLNAVL